MGVGILTADDDRLPGEGAALVATADQQGAPLAPGRRPLGVEGADVPTSRPPVVSRSKARPVLASVQRATKHELLPVAKQDMAGGLTVEVAPSDPKAIAISMLADYGWSSDQFSCLDAIYARESAWDPRAQNPSSGAYGLGQALPGSKMAAYGADWATNPETQLEWGLAYIRDRYGSPCGAWSFWQSNNWY